MIDEHFMRHWNDGHTRFSMDLDRALDRVGRLVVARRGEHVIGKPYARKPGTTLVSGLAAVVTTIALFVTVAALATPAPADEAIAYVELA